MSLFFSSDGMSSHRWCRWAEAALNETHSTRTHNDHVTVIVIVEHEIQQCELVQGPRQSILVLYEEVKEHSQTWVWVFDVCGIRQEVADSILDSAVRIRNAESILSLPHSIFIDSRRCCVVWSSVSVCLSVRVWGPEEHVLHPHRSFPVVGVLVRPAAPSLVLTSCPETVTVWYWSYIYRRL